MVVKMEYRILIIDDDKELCALLKRSAETEGIRADLCHTGREGLELLGGNTYQLVVLDVMMPVMDGFETLERIRAGSSVPILMLTSRNDNGSKVHGLRQGADDYLTKPFDMQEFLARVQSLIRRYTRFNGQGEAAGRLVFRGLTIDTDNYCVTTDRGSCELPPKEFEVLLWLVRHQGKILTKKQIYEAVWQEEYVYDDSNIMAVISRLRKKIEPDAASPFFIQTVKGIGYRFNREA